MTQEVLLKQIADQLGVLTRLVAVAVGQGKTQREQIEALSRAGLEPKQIAEIVGSTSNAVSVAIYKMKASPRRRKA